MRIRRNIPTFIFGVSIGLLAGVGFFVFKINDVFNRIKSTASGTVTVIEQPVKNVPLPDEETKKKNDPNYYLNREKVTGSLVGQAPVLWTAALLLDK